MTPKRTLIDEICLIARPDPFFRAWLDTDILDIDLAFAAKKDLFSPGAMDLGWDGYDHAFNIESIQKDIKDNEANDYKVADFNNSLRTKGLVQFDEFYRDILELEMRHIDAGSYFILNSSLFYIGIFC